MRQNWIRAGAMLLLVSPVMAEELPARKPGLWQIDMATSAGGTASTPRAMQMSMCMDTRTDIQAQQMATGPNGLKCSRRDMKRSGDTIVMDSVCDLGNTQSTSHIVITFRGDTAYHMDIKSAYAPPLAGQAERVMTQDAKWTGACPADMKPGDMIMPNGRRISGAGLPHTP